MTKKDATFSDRFSFNNHLIPITSTPLLSSIHCFSPRLVVEWGSVHHGARACEGSAGRGGSCLSLDFSCFDGKGGWGMILVPLSLSISPYAGVGSVFVLLPLRRSSVVVFLLGLWQHHAWLAAMVREPRRMRMP